MKNSKEEEIKEKKELTMFDDVKKGEKLKKNIKSKIDKRLKNKMSGLGEIKQKYQTLKLLLRHALIHLKIK